MRALTAISPAGRNLLMSYSQCGLFLRQSSMEEPIRILRSESNALVQKLGLCLRLRVVPHFSSGIVERAKRERAWKSPHARRGNTRRGDFHARSRFARSTVPEEKWGTTRSLRQSPSFWTNALLSERKTLIGSSMELCQHLSKTRQPPSTLDIITIYRTDN